MQQQYRLCEKAKKRVKNPLPIPTHCHCCNSPDIGLTSNEIIYHKRYGRWPFVWYCFNCRAAVGCHPQTEIPLGFLADRDTRQMRRRVHQAFDPLWKQPRRQNRSQAYQWLAGQLDMDPEVCHISYFDIPLCEKALKILELHRRGKIA